MSDDDYRILFAECGACGHVLGEHSSPSDDVARPCFGLLGVSGDGERLFCSCAAYRAAKEGK